jgi:hypothetical protein
MGWQESRRQSLPLVSETHPTLGAQFRFLTGQPVPLPDARGNSALAFVSWEYMSALRGYRSSVATFQEDGGSAPCFLAVLKGPLAVQALEAEAAFRPLLIKRTQYTVESMDLAVDWLRQNRKAWPWARSVFVDYLVHCGLYLGRLNSDWVADALEEKLVTSRPLMVLAEGMSFVTEERALEILRHARGIDPHNVRLWDLEEGILRRLGRQKDLELLLKERKILEDKLQLFLS